MAEITFSRFLYPDTNVLGALARDQTKWAPLQAFLHRNDLCLAISMGQVAELSDARHLHRDLGILLSTVPAIVTRTLEQIFEAEVAAYPNERRASILGGYLNEFFLTNRVEQFLSSAELATARATQRASAEQMASRLEVLKANFPPRADGRYRDDQADEFVWQYVLQWLGQLHPTFLSRFRADASSLSSEPFFSIAIMGYTLFYKYYVHAKKPKPSDFGDLFHLYAIPYCDLAILERDLTHVLTHIKRNHLVLAKTAIRSIDFFTDWSF